MLGNTSPFTATPVGTMEATHCLEVYICGRMRAKPMSSSACACFLSVQAVQPNACTKDGWFDSACESSHTNLQLPLASVPVSQNAGMQHSTCEGTAARSRLAQDTGQRSAVTKAG